MLQLSYAFQEKPILLITSIQDGVLISACIILNGSTRRKSIEAVDQLNCSIDCPAKYFNWPSRKSITELLNPLVTLSIFGFREPAHLICRQDCLLLPEATAVFIFLHLQIQHFSRLFLTSPISKLLRDLNFSLHAISGEADMHTSKVRKNFQQANDAASVSFGNSTNYIFNPN